MQIFKVMTLTYVKFHSLVDNFGMNLVVNESMSIAEKENHRRSDKNKPKRQTVTKYTSQNYRGEIGWDLLNLK